MNPPSVRFPRRNRLRREAGLIAPLLITMMLVLWQGGQSLWRDEASSLWFARQSLPTLLTALCDPHPPGYYLLLKGWQFGGDQELWLRLPSLAAALLGVALTYRLGLKLGGRRWAGLALLLLAWHPLQVWYGGEARMYSLAQAGGLVLVWLGVTILTARPGRWYLWLGYAVLVPLILSLDYVLLLPFFLLQGLWLALGRPKAGAWLGLQATVLVAGGWLWLDPARWTALNGSYHAVFIAIRAGQMGVDLTPGQARIGLQLGVIGLALIGLWLAWQWPRRMSDSGRGWPLAGIVLSGWLVLLLVSGVPRGYTLKRLLVVLLPYLALLTAYVLARRSSLLKGLVVALGLGLAVLVMATHQREPWRQTVADLVASAGPNTAIWVDELAVPVFAYYWPGPPGSTPADWAPLIGRQLPTLPDLAPPAGGELWIISADERYRRLTLALPPEFYQSYALQRVEAEQGLYRFIYHRRDQAPPTPVATPVPGPIVTWGLQLPSPLDQCQA
ncbi:MAG: hypothetical protein R3264_14070, partial [Anaerolineae bacterium]|nr:hypothetical protein [Anaerolineae bacterium]